MNRKERRASEKKLGLQKYYKTYSRSKRFEMLQERVQQGRRKEEEMKKKFEISINKQNGERYSNIVASLAQDIAIREKMPYIDAMEKAEKEFEKINRK